MHHNTSNGKYSEIIAKREAYVKHVVHYPCKFQLHLGKNLLHIWCTPNWNRKSRNEELLNTLIITYKHTGVWTSLNAAKLWIHDIYLFEVMSHPFTRLTPIAGTSCFDVVARFASCTSSVSWACCTGTVAHYNNNNNFCPKHLWHSEWLHFSKGQTHLKFHLEVCSNIKIRDCTSCVFTIANRAICFRREACAARRTRCTVDAASSTVRDTQRTHCKANTAILQLLMTHFKHNCMKLRLTMITNYRV